MKNKFQIESLFIKEEKIIEVQNEILSDKDLLLVSNLYKVISDPTRIKIIYALEKRELCVSDISVILNMTQSSISHQLKTLKNAMIVKSRKDGKVVFYSLKDEHIHQIFNQALAHVFEV
jgi:ArsR family transcriptional regulator, lead/cadmium/zinc/bismuth-responsive transcriptional repressor